MLLKTMLIIVRIMPFMTTKSASHSERALHGPRLPVTVEQQSSGIPPPLALREGVQARTDFASILINLEILMRRVNQLPTASDLWCIAMLFALIGGLLGIVGVEAFWRYFPCGPG
jgi:hypothetical protein